MISEITEMFSTSISAVSGWFVDLMTKTGATPLYLVMVFMFLVCSFLLAPLFKRSFGGAGSDKAEKRRDSE